MYIYIQHICTGACIYYFIIHIYNKHMYMNPSYYESMYQSVSRYHLTWGHSLRRVDCRGFQRTRKRVAVRCSLCSDRSYLIPIESWRQSANLSSRGSTRSFPTSTSCICTCARTCCHPCASPTLWLRVHKGPWQPNWCTDRERCVV